LKALVLKLYQTTKPWKNDKQRVPRFSCRREIGYTRTLKVFEENLPSAKLRKERLRGKKVIWPS
jgi:hypothetical protein